MQNNESTGIHCKVNYNDQIRRFHFVESTEFISLKETIARLFSITDEFVLKYLDDEKEYITLESQEDYFTALEITPTILRLTICKPTTSPVTNSSSDSGEDKKRCGKKNRHHPHHHRGGFHKKHHGRFNGGDSPIPEYRKQRLEQKLLFITHCLDALSADESQLNPWELRHKQRLLKKKERITACLGGNCPRKQRAELSEESKQFNAVLKQQIGEVKNEMRTIKGKIRELKILLQERRGDKELLDQIIPMKEKKYLLRGQIRSLYSQFKSF
jgi:hypothetical protein